MKVRSKNFIQFALLMAALFFQSINSRADIVYVWSNDGTIQKFTTNGVASLVTNNISGLNGPVGLTCDNLGNLYSGSPEEGSIRKFLPDGNASFVGPMLDSVSGLAFDSRGSLFATIPNYSEILKLNYSPGYGYVLSGPYTQSYLSYPINLAFDGGGNIFVANSVPPFFGLFSSTNTIEKFSTNFAHLGTFATNLNNPCGLAFDGQGILFVSNSGTNGSLANTIVKFSTNGIRSTFATDFDGLSNPRGLAFDSAGYLYVANSGDGTVLKFSPDGTSSVFASGLNTPSSIAIFPGLKLWSATALKLNNPTILPDGEFQFSLIENSGLSFTVLATTDVSLPQINWATIGSVTEISPGRYQFTDPQATNNSRRFYQIRSP